MDIILFLDENYIGICNLMMVCAVSCLLYSMVAFLFWYFPYVWVWVTDCLRCSYMSGLCLFRWELQQADRFRLLVVNHSNSCRDILNFCFLDGNCLKYN